MKNDNWITKKIISHRGEESENVLENTSQSFENAIEKNMIIEMDVLLTKDNHLIVFHDAHAKRLLGVNKRIKNMTLEEIQSLSLPNGEKVMTLDDALKQINHRTEVIVDIKPQISVSKDRVVSAFNKVFKEYHKEENNDISVQSFDPFLLKKIRKNNPGVLIGQLAFLVEDFIFATFLKPDYLSVNVKMFNFFHNLRKKRSLPLIGWNVKENNFLQALDSFDNLILDLEHHTDDAFRDLKKGLSEIRDLLKKVDIDGLKSFKENYEKLHSEGYLEKILDKFKFKQKKDFIVIDGKEIKTNCILNKRNLNAQIDKIIDSIEKFAILIHFKENMSSIREKSKKISKDSKDLGNII